MTSESTEKVSRSSRAKIEALVEKRDIWRPVMQYLTNMLQDANAECLG